VTLELLVLGLGKRVKECALPAIAAAGDAVRVRGIFARTARTERAAGESHEVRALEDLTQADLTGGPTVYLCVPKQAIPQVLARLAELDPSGCRLLIDTPVVRLRDFRAVKTLQAWRSVSVAEDCARLPWIPAVHALEQDLGPLQAVAFEHAAYAYHGVATGRALAGGGELDRAQRQRAEGGSLRTLHYERGLEVEVLDPRDYATGRVLARYERGLASDRPLRHEDCTALEPELDAAGRVVAIRAGSHRLALTEAEASLTVGSPENHTLVQRQEAMKRVGFLRLLHELAAGEPGYELMDGLEDMVADHLLERLGRYRSSPWTSPRSALARGLFSLASRLGG
jgi:hypothetical protein